MKVPRSVISKIILQFIEIATAGAGMASGAYKWCVEHGFILAGDQGGPSETVPVPALEAYGTSVVVVGFGALVGGYSCFVCRVAQYARGLEI